MLTLQIGFGASMAVAVDLKDPMFRMR